MKASLPFGDLPAYRPRQFVPSAGKLRDWSQILPLFEALRTRNPECKTVGELEKWVRDWSELTAVVDEEGARRYIAMTLHTDDAEVERAYLDFVENIDPKVKVQQFTLAKLYTGHALRDQLPLPRYQVFNRDTKLQVELFRPENVPLETEEAKTGQQYQKITGSLTVVFQGQEQTLIQMGRYLEEPDPELRRKAWELLTARRLQEAAKYEDIFDKLVGLRHQIAQNAGFQNYRDYAFRRLGRFDYTAADCEAFHQAVEAEVMPLIRQVQARRRRQLRLPALRPWDLAVDPLNRPPLRPFQTIEELVAGSQRIFSSVDSELAQDFRTLDQLHLLDLDNRKGKAPGGYQWTLAEARVPFIFANAVGQQRDVETILHEGGHAFHALASRDDDIFSYRNPPIEFCEVASMSMELLGNEYIEEFYPPEEANRARQRHLENILTALSWIATVDAFQHWIYTHPKHSRAERSAAWLDLMRRFEGDVDWKGYEQARAHLWHRQLHIFLNPFYYIEYGIAQLGALQVWSSSRHDKGQAVSRYKSSLRLGGSRPLPELFSAAGCEFDFSRKTLQPLMRLVRDELLRYS